MALVLADVTGVETIKTLVACLGVPDFTVDELAQQAGISRRTVDTVVRRYEYAFDRLPSDKQRGPGRPPVRWRLRADHLDEVVAVVGSHQAALGVGQRPDVAGAPESATVEASLIMAATALGRRSDDPGQTKQLVATARNSLAAAGFGSDRSSWTGHPDQRLASRARFIAAAADVVDACLSGDQQRIDQAQARAMPYLEDAKQCMSATEWMPLAQKVLRAPGTVLSAPVLVEEGSVGYFRELFPTLRALLREKDVPAGFVFMADMRAEQPVSSTPVTSLLNFKNAAHAKRKWAATIKLPNRVVVSRKPEVLAPAAENGARFILHRENEAAKTEIANAVNWRVAWEEGWRSPQSIGEEADEQEPLEARFGTVFDLVGQAASRLGTDDAETRPWKAEAATVGTMTLHPRTYNEARTIGEHFREGTPVVMNLTEMVDSDAIRLVDFSAGLIFGLRGSIDRVTNKVFLLSPAHVEVTAEDKTEIAARTRSQEVETRLRKAAVQIETLHPRTYNEARTIGEHFRDGTPVVMNLTEMVDSDAIRLVDFSAGLIFGLRGSIDRVTNKVFLLSPAHVEVTAEDRAHSAEYSFFNKSSVPASRTVAPEPDEGTGFGSALPAASHAEVLDRVYAYLDGELDDLDYAVIRQHLDECEACLREYGLEEEVKRLVAKHCGHDQGPAELRISILAQIREVRGAIELSPRGAPFSKERN